MTQAIQTVSRCVDFIDLFAGIGGIRLGFERIGARCVFTSEWDRFAPRTYLANHQQDHEVAGDIRSIPSESVPAHQVLLAGFPCQPFSLSGVSKRQSLGRAHGFACQTQGTLFFEIVRLLAHHRPKAFLLENVKNLVAHDQGRTFEIIRETLRRDLGYHLHWRVINARGWVPQNRERIYLVGFREPNAFDWNDVDLLDPASGPTLRDILHPEDGSELTEAPYTEGPQAKVAAKYTLSEHLWGYLQDRKRAQKAKGNGFGFALFGPEDVGRTLSARYGKDGSELLIRQDGRPPRKLTPRECARLMGYPDTFRIPVSDTQAYRQFGNSVAVPVIEAIAKGMAKYL